MGCDTVNWILELTLCRMVLCIINLQL